MPAKRPYTSSFDTLVKETEKFHEAYNGKDGFNCEKTVYDHYRLLSKKDKFKYLDYIDTQIQNAKNQKVSSIHGTLKTFLHKVENTLGAATFGFVVGGLSFWALPGAVITGYLAGAAVYSTYNEKDENAKPFEELKETLEFSNKAYGIKR